MATLKLVDAAMVNIGHFISPTYSKISEFVDAVKRNDLNVLSTDIFTD